MKALRFPLLFLAFAAACGLVRWIDTFRTISSAEIRFSHLNDVHWDDVSKRLSVAGSDPYLLVDLPENATPIQSAAIHFIGHYVETEGIFYFFSSTGAVNAAQVRQGPATFSIRGDLNRSNSLRLDLPDFLPRFIRFDYMQIRKPFTDWSSWPFRLALLGFAAALASLLLCLRHRTRAS